MRELVTAFDASFYNALATSIASVLKQLIPDQTVASETEWISSLKQLAVFDVRALEEKLHGPDIVRLRQEPDGFYAEENSRPILRIRPLTLPDEAPPPLRGPLGAFLKAGYSYEHGALLEEYVTKCALPAFAEAVRSTSAIEIIGGRNVAESLRADARARATALGTLTSNPQPRQRDARLEAVSRLIPEQELAPARFEIKDGRIVIRREINHTEPADQANADLAREELLRAGGDLLTQLESTNSDPVISKHVRYLHRLLADRASVIRIGIANLGLEEIVRTNEDELRGSLAASLRAFARGINLFASQFPDWERFVSNSIRDQLETEDARHATTVARQLAGELERNPELADPEVPHTLKFFAELRASPARAAKRLTFALVRMLENLIKVTAKFASDVLSGALDEAKTLLRKPLGRGIAVALLGLALHGAVGLGPLAEKVTELRWIKDVRILIEEYKRTLIRPE